MILASKQGVILVMQVMQVILALTGGMYATDKHIIHLMLLQRERTADSSVSVHILS